MFRYLIARLYSSKTRFSLRPYQERCIDACLDALAAGASRIGVSLPTGAGKTTVFISLLSRLYPPPASPTARRSLIVVNSVELARQSAEQVAFLFPSWKVEIEQGYKHQATGDADVTVATYQTLLNPQRLKKFDPRHLKAIIVDEAHHAAAPSYRRLLSHFDADIQSPDSSFELRVLPHKIPIIGFSATFNRHDGLALGSVFEQIVYHRDFLQMIKEEWLCGVRFTSVRAKLNLKSVTVNSVTGDFTPTSLAQVVNSASINELVVKTWIDRAATRKSTLVFCVNISHVVALTKTFREHGIDARYVYAKTPVMERQALIASFRAGQFPMTAIFLAILTEGADIPNIDCVVVARPTRSRNLFAQMIGRGMRLSPSTGKQDCRIIDFVDSTSRVAGVVSVPTLFGLSPGEIDIDDDTPESLERRAEEFIASNDADNVPQPTTVTYIEYDDPFSLVGDSSGLPHISTLSNNAWVACGGDIYVLDLLGRGHIRVEPTESIDGATFYAHFTPTAMYITSAQSLLKSPFLQNREILSAATLSDAIRGCDTYLANKFSALATGLLRSASWRNKPATDGQKSLVLKWWKRSHININEEVIREKIGKITKGQAASIITRVKHGAQRRHEKKLKVLANEVRRAAKEKIRQDREVVQVGPLLT